MRFLALTLALLFSVAPASANGPLFSGGLAPRYIVSPPIGGVAVGLWADPNLGSQVTAITSREASVGRTFALHTSYWGFNGGTPLSTISDATASIADDEAHARIPNVSWGCSSAQGTTFAGISAGNYDSVLDATFAATATTHTRMIVRWTWEMNLNHNNPSSNPNGNNCFATTGTAEEAEYKNAWVYIVNYQKNYYKTHNYTNNITWEWCPAVSKDDYNAVPIDHYYPGNTYVDIVGGDTYLKSSQTTALTFVGIWQTFWNHESGRGKPLAIVETGAPNNLLTATNTVGTYDVTQPTFFSDALTALKPGGAFNKSEKKRISFFSYFDHDVAEQWSLANLGTDGAVANGLSAFATMVNDPYFTKPLPG